MSFFQSEFVQEELKTIQDLQEKVYENVFTFSTMSRADKIYHIEMLEELLNRQQVLYARMSLSDDPEAKEMKENIMTSAQQLGFPPDVDLGFVFKNMTNIITNMKRSLGENS